MGGPLDFSSIALAMCSLPATCLQRVGSLAYCYRIGNLGASMPVRTLATTAFQTLRRSLLSSTAAALPLPALT